MTPELTEPADLGDYINLLKVFYHTPRALFFTAPPITEKVQPQVIFKQKIP